MFDRLFGPHRSVQRQACIWLTILVILLGLAIIPSSGLSRGIPVALLGVLAGAVLARMAENRVAAKASAELLDAVSSDVDEEQLRRMVDQARTESPAKMPMVDQVGEPGDSLPFTGQDPTSRSS